HLIPQTGRSAGAFRHLPHRAAASPRPAQPMLAGSPAPFVERLAVSLARIVALAFEALDRVALLLLQRGKLALDRRTLRLELGGFGSVPPLCLAERLLGRIDLVAFRRWFGFCGLGRSFGRFARP